MKRNDRSPKKCTLTVNWKVHTLNQKNMHWSRANNQEGPVIMPPTVQNWHSTYAFQAILKHRLGQPCLQKTKRFCIDWGMTHSTTREIEYRRITNSAANGQTRWYSRFGGLLPQHVLHTYKDMFTKIMANKILQGIVATAICSLIYSSPSLKMTYETVNLSWCLTFMWFVSRSLDEYYTHEGIKRMPKNLLKFVNVPSTGLFK